jgi:hypothetical protein
MAGGARMRSNSASNEDALRFLRESDLVTEANGKLALSADGKKFLQELEQVMGN